MEGYHKCLHILIDYIKMRANEKHDILAHRCLVEWDRERAKVDKEEEESDEKIYDEKI